MIESKSVKENLAKIGQVRLEVDGFSTAIIELTGTFVATVIFEYTINGEDWNTMTVTVFGSATEVTGATAVGKWKVDVSGFQQIRVRSTAHTSGTVEVAMRAVVGSWGSSGSGGDIQSAGADGASNTADAQTTNSRISGFNGTTWDRLRAGITTVTATLTGFLNTLPWGVYNATPATRTEGQGGPLQTDSTGGLIVTPKAQSALLDSITAKLATDAIMNGTTALTPKFAVIDAATSGDNTLVAAVTGKKIRVIALFSVSAGTLTARLESGAGGTALTGQMNLVANTGFVLPFNPVGWCETAEATLLNLELSAATSVDGCLVYVEV